MALCCWRILFSRRHIWRAILMMANGNQSTENNENLLPRQTSSISDDDVDNTQMYSMRPYGDAELDWVNNHVRGIIEALCSMHASRKTSYENKLPLRQCILQSSISIWPELSFNAWCRMVGCKSIFSLSSIFLSAIYSMPWQDLRLWRQTDKTMCAHTATARDQRLEFVKEIHALGVSVQRTRSISTRREPLGLASSSLCMLNYRNSIPFWAHRNTI